jgi:hypothetical protein
MSMKKTVTSWGIEPTTFRLVVQCLNHYATARPNPIAVKICIISYTGINVTGRRLRLSSAQFFCTQFYNSYRGLDGFSGSFVRIFVCMIHSTVCKFAAGMCVNWESNSHIRERFWSNRLHA